MATPRMTKSWKTRYEEHSRLFKEAMGDKGTEKTRQDAVHALSKHLAATPAQRESTFAEYLASRDGLTNLLQKRFPDMAYVFGVYLCEWLDAWFLTQLGYSIPEGLARRIEHLGPDNPLEILPGGDVRNMDRASSPNVFDLRNYYRSLEPESRQGRPPLRTAQAIRVYQMYLDGKHWPEIAGIEFPDYDDSNIGQREKMRKRIDRLRERGAIESDRIR